MSPQICKTSIAIIIYVLKDTEREQQNLEKVRPWLIKSAFPSHPDNVVCETLAKILTTEKAGAQFLFMFCSYNCGTGQQVFIWKSLMISYRRNEQNYLHHCLCLQIIKNTTLLQKL